jgi:hypothetical protein
MTDEGIRPATNYQAMRIVGLIGEAHQREMPTGEDRENLVRAIAATLDPTDTACPTDGQAATAAMELLAKDPRFAGHIEAIVNGPETKALGFGVVEGTFLISGLLMALQTQFEFERDRDGRWSVKIRKKATSDALLKPLIKKLTDMLGLGR